MSSFEKKSADGEDVESHPFDSQQEDVFGSNEGEHQIQYRTLSWQFVAWFMIAEIVSNGMLSLPAALAVTGIVPGVILIIFLGAFGMFTAKLLIDFKLNHPAVHSMGDAGYIIFGPLGREVLAAGTIIFAICGTGSELLSGQLALTTLSDDGLCALLLLLIFSAAVFLLALPRTLDRLNWLGLAAAVSIIIAGILGMIGAGTNPTLDRTITAARPNTFYQAFLAITNPVFAYAGHFMFFILISEMRRPQDAIKAAWVLQTTATAFYVLFAVVVYVYLGDTVASPAFLSLPPVWAKIAFGIALPNFLVAGALYAHAAAKMIFVRIFRHSKHLHTHTILAWSAWTALVFLAVVIAFIFTISVNIFAYLIGITASLFASWYTYGIAGFFWLHDARHYPETRPRSQVGYLSMIILSLLTIIAGAFICVAGTYVSIKLIVQAYQQGLVPKPFTC